MPLQDSRSATAAAAAAIARGGTSEAASDIEAPLLGHRQAAQQRAEPAANGGTPGLPGSPIDSRVQGGAQHAQRRDPRKLWALVRNSLGGCLQKGVLGGHAGHHGWQLVHPLRNMGTVEGSHLAALGLHAATLTRMPCL